MCSRQSSPSGTRDSVVANVVRSVARAEGVTDTELTPPLEAVVDTDALERYVESTGESARVSFRYRDNTIEVRGDRIEVTTPDDE